MITAGTAIREVVTILKNAGATIAGVLVALDRQERGQGELSAIQEVQKIRNSCARTDYHERFNGLFGSERRKEAANMQAYREKYGI